VCAYFGAVDQQRARTEPTSPSRQVLAPPSPAPPAQRPPSARPDGPRRAGTVSEEPAGGRAPASPAAEGASAQAVAASAQGLAPKPAGPGAADPAPAEARAVPAAKPGAPAEGPGAPVPAQTGPALGDPGNRDATALYRAAGRSRITVPAAKKPDAVAGKADARPEADKPRSAGSPPRFTATGIGVVTCAITLFGGALDALLLGGPHVLFGLCFLLACLFAAARVRASDLMAAPISAPLAFALTLLLTLPNDGGGLSGHVIALATGLATRAGWLYAGTLVAAGLAILRYFTLRAARRPGKA
jgi:hypothetical protein